MTHGGHRGPRRCATASASASAGRVPPPAPVKPCAWSTRRAAAASSRWPRTTRRPTAPTASPRRPRRSGSYRTVGVPAPAPSKRVTVLASLKARTSTRHVLGGRTVARRGRLLPAIRGRRVARSRCAAGAGWRTVDATRTGRGGRVPRAPGAGPPRAAQAAPSLRRRPLRRSRGRPLWRVNSYRAGHASWYGPGPVRQQARAAAARSRPARWARPTRRCPVAPRSRSATTGARSRPAVIDRGPYVGGREWDLTEASSAKLASAPPARCWTTR